MACLNAKFHELIIDFSDNMRLKKLVNELKSLTNYYRFLNLEGEDRPNVIYRGHFEIFQAIKERNPEKASQKLKEHTHDDLENLVNLLNHKRER
jgi:DNA-binding GntR family transcriptional regulator